MRNNIQIFLFFFYLLLTHFLIFSLVVPALVLGGTGTSVAEQLVRWKHRASLRTGWQEVALPRLHNHASRNSNVEVIKGIRATYVGRCKGESRYGGVVKAYLHNARNIHSG